MVPEQLGPYKIGRLLGRGGMGAVYEGTEAESGETDVESGETVAVKVLPAVLDDNSGFRQRFDAEIEVLKKLRHPNIVRLLGFGEQEGLVFYSMELIDGPSLLHFLRSGRRLACRDVVRIGIGLCRALKHAHDRGITHRDIKPANILIATSTDVSAKCEVDEPAIRSEDAKLSDFGIARMFGDSGMTTAGAVVGTIEFMSPEQASADPVGPRSDLYSLGAVLYSLLAGRPPFLAKSLPEILKKQRSENPSPLRELANAPPVELAELIEELLHFDPSLRPSNAHVLRLRLEAIEDELRDLDEAGSPASQIGEEFGSSDASGPTRTRHAAEAASGESVGGCSVSESGGLPPTLHAPLMESSREVDAATPTKVRDADADAEQADGMSEQTAKSRKTRFVSVQEDELDRSPDSAGPHALLSLQTWLLIIGLVGLWVVVWRFLQPLGPDELHDRIQKTISEGTIASYRDAQNDMREFIAKFPQDRRCGPMHERLRELELYNEERRFEQLVGASGDLADLLPVERAYIEAIGEARASPEGGLEKLRAVVDLFRSEIEREDEPQAGPEGVCVELARRRIASLERQVQEYAEREVRLLGDRLDRADRIEPDDPRRANEIRRALIEIYQDKPWAAAAVDRATEALTDANDENPSPE